MELNIPLLFSVAFLVAAVAVFTATKSARSHSSRFPGPTQLPLIGRVHDLPLTSAWLKLKEWADIYGPIYQTSMMGQRFIVVSNEDMARDILIKKGNSFSGRLQIRALIDHKLGPTYVALQDRNGMLTLVLYDTAEVCALTTLRDVEKTTQMGSCCDGGCSSRALLRAH